jgi:hypothetical protein
MRWAGPAASTNWGDCTCDRASILDSEPTEEVTASIQNKAARQANLPGCCCICECLSIYKSLDIDFNRLIRQYERTLATGTGRNI